MDNEKIVHALNDLKIILVGIVIILTSDKNSLSSVVGWLLILIGVI